MKMFMQNHETLVKSSFFCSASPTHRLCLHDIWTHNRSFKSTVHRSRTTNLGTWLCCCVSILALEFLIQIIDGIRENCRDASKTIKSLPALMHAA